LPARELHAAATRGESAHATIAAVSMTWEQARQEQNLPNFPTGTDWAIM
jgi:hypothetical protein